MSNIPGPSFKTINQNTASTQGLWKDLRSELYDADSVIKDVSLVGTDGGHVPAAKAILAMRSPVFRKMFYGEFKEASGDCDSVEMNYPADVLGGVVSYCYVGIPSLNKSTKLTDEDAATYVQARDAAIYLELEEFKIGMSQILNNRRFGSVCAIMQELMIREGTDGDLFLKCVSWLKLSPRKCLLPSSSCNAGIRGCSFPLLKIIFELIGGVVPAYTAVEVLISWTETHDAATTEEQSELQELADSIDLNSIETCDLVQIQPCSLFQQDRLFNALVDVGKRVKRK